VAIYTFSTKETKPEDTRVVTDVKEICEHEGKNFSALVVRLLREWRDSRDERTTEV
jgi:hypothetical protein